MSTDAQPAPQQRPGLLYDDFSVGQRFLSPARTITEADIVLFAGVSGDNNAVHINEEFAATTRFKGRIAHGMLSASVISAAIANKLPGPGTIYLKQSLEFKAPVKAGDTVHAKVSVRDLVIDKKLVVLETVCTVRGTVVITGEALVKVGSRQ